MNSKCTIDNNLCDCLLRCNTLPSKDGLCLFHSEDSTFSQDFSTHFMEFITLIDDNKGPSIVIKNFVFKSDTDVLIIEGLKVSRPLQFVDCKFLKKLSLVDCNFENGIEFKDCTFEKGLRIEKGKYGSFGLQNVHMNGQMRIVNLDSINNFFILSKTHFHNGFYIQNIDMPLISHINDCIVDMQTMRDIVYIMSVNFHEFTMEDTEFTAQFIMDKIEFNKTSRIERVSFKTPTSEINQYDNVMKMSNISIPHDSRLVIKGTSDFKLTEVDTFISFSEMNGYLEFDYVDFNYISAKSRNQIFELEKEGKALITNSTKYRHRTDIVEIPLRDTIHYLGEELSQTFSRYFNHNNAYDIGVEIVGRSTSVIKLYYYTNEKISKQHFLERLGIGANRMWGLITNSTSNNTEIVSAGDYETKVNLASFMLKLGPKLINGEMTKQDLSNVIKVVGGVDDVMLDTLEASAKVGGVNIMVNYLQSNNIQYNNNTYIHRVEQMGVKEIESILNQKFSDLSEGIKSMKSVLVETIESRSLEEKKLIIQLTEVVESKLLDSKKLELFQSRFEEAVTKIELSKVLADERKIFEEYIKSNKSNVSLKQKVKFTVQVIPMFLKYETEVDVNLKAWFRGMISDFKNGDIFIKE